MYSSTSNHGPLVSEECSGSSSNILVHHNIKLIETHDVENIGLMNLASEDDDDEVQFDSKQLYWWLLLAEQCLSYGS